MRSKKKIIISVLALALVAFLSTFFLKDMNFEILNTAGEIGNKQKDLLIFTTLLSLIVIIPVFFLTFHIAWKYRASNPKAKYSPDWDGDKRIEFVWWAIPIILILILAVVTWITSHSLDPRKPIESDKATLKVQVIALDWKWLFIYPEEKIATVNYLMIPEDTPIEFNITSDAPMNSFSIPQLGGQIYAMNGMSSKLHLIADRTGTFRGQSANLSGEGFADMTFSAVSVTQTEYDTWTKTAASAEELDYSALAKPSRANQPKDFSVVKQPMLYNDVVNKYADHASSKPNQHDTESH